MAFHAIGIYRHERVAPFRRFGDEFTRFCKPSHIPDIWKLPSSRLPDLAAMLVRADHFPGLLIQRNMT